MCVVEATQTGYRNGGAQRSHVVVDRYLRNHDGTSDIAALLTQHHLLEIVQTLVVQYNASAKLRAFAEQDEECSNAVGSVFTLIEDLVRVPQLPVAADLS